MADEDNPLRGVDLSAWEAPPPPAGLADAVMARMHAPPAALPVDEVPRRSHRAWLFAAVAALVLGAAAVLAFGIARPPRAGHGDIAAAAPEHLSLGAASSAELDPGAEVHWQRTRARLTAGQPRGAVMWTVGGDDTLQIDAGAAVASVEASGARLRVEVHMNMMDAKIIGSAALTSAAVALVTVVVYEGHAKVASEGKTVVVEAGQTYEVRPPAPGPVADQWTIGASVPLPETLTLAVAGDTLKAMDPHAGTCPFPDGRYLVTVDITARPDGVVTDVAFANAPKMFSDCYAKLVRGTRMPVTQRGGTFTEAVAYERKPDVPCDADALAREAARLDQGGDPRAALDRVQRAIACGGMLLPWVHDATRYACRAHDRLNAHFFFENVPLTQRDSLVQACLQEHIELAPAAPTPDAPECKDAKEVIAKAEAQFARGSPTMALATLETRLHCTTDPRVLRLAGLYACGAENQQAAEKYFDRVANNDQIDILMECGKHGLSVGNTAPGPPLTECEDVSVVLRKAETQFSAGFPTQAVNTLEIRMRCGSDVRLLRTAGLYACRGHNEALARKYYKLVDAKFQGSMLQACQQEGIALP